MIGRTLSHYQIIERLGEGGMGTVYRAQDTKLDREVAIKMVHPHLQHDHVLLERFKNEALLSARINHPNVTTLYQILEEQGRSYLVMEYVDGDNLETLLQKKGSFSVATVIAVLIQLLEGLENAHTRGVIHRDIKPGNLMLSKAGYIKLMDFGIARLTSSRRLTRINHVIGTSSYLAPELMQGAEPTPASDIYAAGVVAWELLFGELPGASLSTKMAWKHFLALDWSNLNETPLKAAPRLQRILSRMLAVKPEKRYQQVQPLLQDLYNLGTYSRINLEQMPGPGPDTEHPRGLIAKVGSLPARMYALLRQPRIPESVEGRIVTGSMILALLIFCISFFTTGTQPEVLPVAESIALQTESETPFKTQVESKPNYLNDWDEQPVEEEAEMADSSQPILPGDRAPVIPPAGEHEKAEQLPETKPEDTDKSKPDEEEVDQVTAEKQENDQIVTPKKQMIEDTTDKSILGEDETVDEPLPTVTKEKEKSVLSRRVHLPEQVFAASLEASVSSDRYVAGQEVSLRCLTSIRSEGVEVIASGARVRARVTEVRSSQTHARAFLAMQLEAVQSQDGQWIDVAYPLYSQRSRSEIVFPRNTVIEGIKIPEQSINLKIHQ